MKTLPEKKFYTPEPPATLNLAKLGLESVPDELLNPQGKAKLPEADLTAKLPESSKTPSEILSTPRDPNRAFAPGKDYAPDVSSILSGETA